tara:strand:+ start:155 stop:712 length:558 start_codon:yes stop_codon:yes gene_type:complete
MSSNTKVTMKRSAAVRAGPIVGSRALKVQRTETMLAEPPVILRAELNSYIVVIQHTYPQEEAINDKHGYLRGLGNTFTLEVMAEGCEDAVTTVENMLGVEFDCTTTLEVRKVQMSPRAHWHGENGRSVTVVSSSQSGVRVSGGTREELVGAAVDDRFITEREGEERDKTTMEVAIAQHIAEAEHE